jgi:hypothetical protein
MPPAIPANSYGTALIAAEVAAGIANAIPKPAQNVSSATRT